MFMSERQGQKEQGLSRSEDHHCGGIGKVRTLRSPSWENFFCWALKVPRSSSNILRRQEGPWAEVRDNGPRWAPQHTV